MESQTPPQPSVLSDPIYRKPHLPGALLRPVDMVLFGAVLLSGMMALPSAMNVLRHSDPESAEAATLREIVRGNHDAAWMMVLLSIGICAAAILFSRLLYRVHRCELLLRWSGIDEGKLLAESVRPQAAVGGRPA